MTPTRTYIGPPGRRGKAIRRQSTAGSHGVAQPSADSLDKELLEQLHAATLKASDSCFEIKKLCATVLVPTGTLVAIFSGRQLGTAVFVAGLLAVALFWLADSVGFYYQRKLRSVMNSVWERRAERCEEAWEAPNTPRVGPLGSAFNRSMTFYALLGIPITIGLVLYWTGVISTPQTPTGTLS